MLNLDDKKELADSLSEAIKEHSLKFLHGAIPYIPVSKFENVNSLYYGLPALLSEDKKGKLNFYGKAGIDIFGYNLDEAIGMDSEKLVPERFLEKRKELFDKILKEKIAIDIEKTYRIHQLGIEVAISAQVFPYELQNGIWSIAAIVEKI